MEPANDFQLSSHNPVSEPREYTVSKWRTVREWVVTIAIALAIAFVIRSFVAEPFIVVGASMDPTFATGNFLIVDRVSYRLHPPQRYDVIVFNFPGDTSQDYIKRVIGLPGETVTIRDGKVSVKAPGDASSTPIADAFVKPFHASHDDFQATLGPDQYFVMGDNRAESSDSRAWGPLDKKYIIGRALVRLFPPTAFSFLPGTYHEPSQTQ